MTFELVRCSSFCQETVFTHVSGTLFLATGLREREIARYHWRENNVRKLTAPFLSPSIPCEPCFQDSSPEGCAESPIPPFQPLSEQKTGKMRLIASILFAACISGAAGFTAPALVTGNKGLTQASSRSLRTGKYPMSGPQLPGFLYHVMLCREVVVKCVRDGKITASQKGMHVGERCGWRWTSNGAFPEALCSCWCRSFDTQALETLRTICWG